MIKGGKIMKLPKREYRFRGADTGSESRLFWIMTLIGLALAFAIFYFL